MRSGNSHEQYDAEDKLHVDPSALMILIAGPYRSGTGDDPEKMADNKYVRFGGRVSFGWLSNDFDPEGYIGDPTDSTPEFGKQLFEGSVTGLVEALAEIATFDFGR